MRHKHCLRSGCSQCLGLGKGFDNGGKICPGIAKEIVDPAIGEKRQIGIGNSSVGYSFDWHEPVLPDEDSLCNYAHET